MNNACTVEEVSGTWLAKYAQLYLRDKRGRIRQFKSEKAAMAAAYFERDGKDNRPLWRKREH